MNAARKQVKPTAMLMDDGTGIDEEDRGKPRILIAIRLPPSLFKYLDKKGKALGRGGITRVGEEAVRLHKRLGERLDSSRIRIQQFALDERLSWPAQEVEVLARLIQRGLDDAERRRK